MPHIPGFNKKEDVEKSKEELRKMGFVRIEEFKYEYSKFVRRIESDEGSLQIPEFLRRKPE